MDSLYIRNNIVREFSNKLSEFKLTFELINNLNLLVLNYRDHLKIYKEPNGTIQFHKKIKCEFNERGWVYTTPLIILNLVKVMEVKPDDSFSMVSGMVNDSWLTVVANPVYSNPINDNHTLETELNMHLPSIPNSEDLHFQLLTTHDIVLDLPECIMLNEMLEKIKSIGSIVQVSPLLKANMLFLDNLQ